MHQGERRDLHHDLRARIRAACDMASKDVDVDDHAERVAREVARARAAREKLVSSRKRP